MKGYDLSSLDTALIKFTHTVTFPAHHGLPQMVSWCLLYAHILFCAALYY